MKKVSPCPNCSGKSIYQTKNPVSAGGGYAPNFLPGLGRFFRTERFNIVICRDCGLTRFFARDEACERLADSSHWERV